MMCLQALETRKALSGAAANSPQSTAVQLYAVINAQSGVVKSQVSCRVDPAAYSSPLVGSAVEGSLLAHTAALAKVSNLMLCTAQWLLWSMALF